MKACFRVCKAHQDLLIGQVSATGFLSKRANVVNNSLLEVDQSTNDIKSQNFMLFQFHFCFSNMVVGC
ncbi:hypothetical protein D3C85_1504790 [compost metagenome]